MIYSEREWHTPAQPELCLRLHSARACAVRVLLGHPHQAMLSRDRQPRDAARHRRKQGNDRGVRQRSIRVSWRCL